MSEIETRGGPRFGLPARADAARALRRRRTAAGFGFLLVTAFCWGLNWPLMKFLLATVPPFTMRAFSGALGAVVAFGMAAALREPLYVSRDQRGRLVLLALLNFTALMGSATLAMLWLSASEAVIIAYTLPLWAALIAWPVLGERPSVIRVVALALGLGGVVVLMGAQPVAASWAKLLGAGISLSGAILFAFGTVLSKARPLRLPALTSLAWQIMIGTAPMIAAAFFEHPHWERMHTQTWVLLAYLGTVPLALAYYTWFRALKLLAASTAATASLLVPMIGVIGSAVLLGEPLGARQILAMAMTLAGIALAARSR